MQSNKKLNQIRVTENIVIEHADIGFRNFSGKESQFNPIGRKNFCVFLEADAAKTLLESGWNIRWTKPRDLDDEERAYLQVAVSYDNMPPKVVLVTKKGKAFLDSTSINVLDWAEIENVDVIIRPYNWIVNGKTGVKAYVKTMYVTIIEDEFAEKYSEVPNSAAKDDANWENEE